MKLILTGSTGFIGQEVLSQCLSHPDITSVVALSRGPLPSAVTDNPKLKVVILKDFNSYPENVLKELEGAEACIWSLGKARSQTDALNRIINLDYTLAGASAFAASIALHLPRGGGFRFVYLSGMAAERDQEKPLWYVQEGRRMRGQVENRLLALPSPQIEPQSPQPSNFGVFIVRPGFVLAKQNGILNSILGFDKAHAIRVDDLATAMVDIALEGKGEQIVENEGLRAKASAKRKE